MRKTMLLAIPLLLLACDREPVAPTAGDAKANFMNNPDNGNARIFRYQSDFFTAWSDNGLRVTHRTLPAPALGDCFEFPPNGAADWNERVMGPIDLTSRWMANVQADVWITVRDLTQPGDCAGNLLIGAGWGRLQYNDNDELSDFGDRNNVNSWSYRGHGTLTAPDGRKVRYNGHAKFVYDPGTGTMRTEQYQIVVN